MFPSFLVLLPAGFIFGFFFDGELYGLFIAIIVIVHINILAAYIAFSFSKLCFKSLVREHIINKSHKLRNVDHVLHKHGTRALFFLRLSPIFPGYIFNYILGSFDSKFKLNNI